MPLFMPRGKTRAFFPWCEGTDAKAAPGDTGDTALPRGGLRAGERDQLLLGLVETPGKCRAGGKKEYDEEHFKARVQE